MILGYIRSWGPARGTCTTPRTQSCTRDLPGRFVRAPARKRVALGHSARRSSVVCFLFRSACFLFRSAHKSITFTVPKSGPFSGPEKRAVCLNNKQKDAPWCHFPAQFLVQFFGQILDHLDGNCKRFVLTPRGHLGQRQRGLVFPQEAARTQFHGPRRSWEAPPRCQEKRSVPRNRRRRR